MSIFRRGLVNPSTLTFSNINLTQTMTDLLVDLKPLKEIYLHTNTFNMSSKSFSYLKPVFHPGPVNLSFPTFFNNNLTKAITYLPVLWKVTEKCLQSIFPPF